jgi:hypothetical protein
LFNGWAIRLLLFSCGEIKMLSSNIYMKRKYGPKAQEKIEKVMHEYKHGKLRSSSGDKVKNRKQAIGISEAREVGAKVPQPKRN